MPPQRRPCSLPILPVPAGSDCPLSPGVSLGAGPRLRELRPPSPPGQSWPGPGLAGGVPPPAVTHVLLQPGRGAVRGSWGPTAGSVPAEQDWGQHRRLWGRELRVPHPAPPRAGLWGQCGLWAPAGSGGSGPRPAVPGHGAAPCPAVALGRASVSRGRELGRRGAWAAPAGKARARPADRAATARLGPMPDAGLLPASPANRPAGWQASCHGDRGCRLPGEVEISTSSPTSPAPGTHSALPLPPPPGWAVGPGGVSPRLGRAGGMSPAGAGDRVVSKQRLPWSPIHCTRDWGSVIGCCSPSPGGARWRAREQLQQGAAPPTPQPAGGTAGPPPALCGPARALYTYEDDSDELKLAASGGGGLLELSSHFEIQKVMYGFCSVKDPQAALPKYVLVNWVGEDVPDARKCACASHVAKIAEFFQGVDVIVNASSVEDIDPGAIGQRLSNGLARISSPVLHRLRLREDENTEPVGTTYQKTDATVEMKRINREQFWEQAKKEEELRKEEERKKALDARLRFEQERMEQERLQQEERERRYREREEQIEEHRRKQQSLEAEEARQRLKEPSIFGDQEEDEERQQLKKSESEVEEAAAIIAQRPDNPREFFKQQERVASGSLDTVSPLGHRTGSQSDTHRKASTGGCSPCDSSTASTPVGEQIERALDEVTLQPRPHDAPSPGSEAAAVAPDQRWPLSSKVQPAKELPGGPAAPGSERTEAPGPGPGPATADLLALETQGPVLLPLGEAEAQGQPLPPPTPAPESLLELWQDDSAAPGAWELLGELAAPGPAEAAVPLAAPEPPLSAGPEDGNLLNFDELPEPPATFCDAEQDEELPSMVALEGTHPMTLSYQHALQEAAGGRPDPLPELMTNGDMALKESTQASEGYFSQSQDDDMTQADEPSAKAPPPVFYNKPPGEPRAPRAGPQHHSPGRGPQRALGPPRGHALPSRCSGRRQPCPNPPRCILV
uniref:Drebrin n=1 Tax=Crocodylus porosus TaxID=8502 RepID=A0A7M4F9F7_CROPO